MLRAGDLLDEHRADITAWLARESGASVSKVDFELGQSRQELVEASTFVKDLPGPQELAPTRPGQTSQAERVPIGVVGLIAPWNGPILLALRTMAPALVLGNAVVLKPSPETPVSGGVILAELFAEAGLPAGVLQVIFGGADVAQAVITDPHVSMVSFTGSTAIGRVVGGAAGQALKRVALELGGNNAFIVLDDADIDRAVDAAVISSFLGQGQGCICAGRHLVHKDVVDEYTTKLVQRATGLRVGDPEDPSVVLGPIISERQHQRICRIVDTSVEAGAELLVGGPGDGLFYNATVLGGVRPGMPVYEEEIFGPVASITAIEDDDEAVRLANDSEYGLTAAVHSRSVEHATRIADQLQTAMVHINDPSNLDAPHVPFGGIGASGNGASFGSPANLEQFTHWRWTTVSERGPELPF
jgi:benzaldehyde dehydrogenase (NAD)